jgi:nicotinamide-nucleotide adenylyltransferase
MRALFIGRFQPFHLGHLKAIEYVSRVADFVVIGVGSSQEKNTTENPFSYEERREMIEHSLTIDKSKYSVVPIPDIGNDALWVKSIVDKLPQFDVIYTNSPPEKKIFREARLQVWNVPLFDRKHLNASEIRRKLSAGENWQELVPKGTAAVIRKVDGVKRIVRMDTS